MHLDEDRIQRLLSDELAPGARAAAQEHAQACAECSRLLDAAERDRREVDALLTLVDHPPPPVDLQSIRARTRSTGWGRLAAAILLALVAAGAAYAVPGSPLKGWVREVVARAGRAPDQSPSSPTPKPAPVSPPAGIAVTPGRSLLLQFTQAHAQEEARVTLTDGSDVVVRAAAGAARFTSDVDRLLIENPIPSSGFEIEIPRAAARVEIRVGSTQVFLKTGVRITARGVTEPAGSYRIPLAVPNR